MTTIQTISLATLFAATTALLGCLDDGSVGFDTDEDAEDIWPEEEIEEPTETTTDLPEGLHAAASDGCSRSFDAAPGHGWILTAFANISFGRKNGTSWIYEASYAFASAHPSRGKNNKIGIKWQVYKNGKWLNASDWVLWDDNLGTSNHSGKVKNGIKTTLPTRAQVRFSWDIKFSPDIAKTCTIRIS